MQKERGKIREARKSELARTVRLCASAISFCILLFAFRIPVLAQRQTTGRTGSVAPSAQADNLSPTARASLDAAVAALQSNALADAERAARAGVQAAPRSAIAHNLLGVVLDRMTRADEAFKEFNTAIAIDQNFVSAHNNLGRMFAERGKFPDAIREFEQTLKIEPQHVQANYNLGAIYGDSGDFVKASEYFSRARQSAPDDPQLALAFLNVAYRANRIAEADAAAASARPPCR